ncbi:HNH endonuclease [Burkholderia multivorans]|uniref:HNH endonuclease n=1 Tax=Burkholderia multivorans TaxID=87883 RepID=UPI0021BFB137|nr:HNH endonuclease [Burkholderia multivorans]
MAELKLKCGRVALVDDADTAAVSGYAWYADAAGYVRCSIPHPEKPGRQTTLRLHRLVLGIPHGGRAVVDHVNGNPLDNRRANLRACGRAENAWNSRPRSTNRSGTTGVSYDNNAGKWRARIGFRNARRSLGLFETKALAVEFRELAESLLYGSFAFCRTGQ